jgi:hypothetical protein
MSIREFAERYVKAGCPHNSDLMRQVFLTDVSTSTLVWTEGLFLVEMYLMHPLAVVVPHSHPFENLAVHWSGKILGRRQGVVGQWLTDKDRGHISRPLSPGSWHAFEVGDTGAIFYNVSRWLSTSEMDSATRKYLGEPLGPMHRQTLESIETNDRLTGQQ